jgi:beta-lactamase regulating signal transducer with metallopeptidase domain
MRIKETMMAGLDSWLSPQVMHALGWALIHSLWQCLACAAVAAVLMALSRRPSVRYLVGVGALAAMLAAPVATFLVLAATPAHLVLAASPGAPLAAPVVSQAPAAPIIHPAAPSPPRGKGDMKGALEGLSVAPLLEEAPALNILPWLVAAWLCGVAFFSLRFAGGFLLLEHLRRNRSAIPGAGLLALCRDVQRQLGLDRAIEYLECAWLQTPAVIGWLRPAVLIPLAALTGLSEAQLRAVIAHELAHIRRFDLLVNLFQIVVETLLFYHPAMWWLNKRIRAERELCCDEIAIGASGNRLEYAKALTLMAEWEMAPRLAMAANRGPLSERIFHILGRKSANAGQRMLGLTGSVLFLVAALAAANALFDIAAPPIAQARESVKAFLSASQTTVTHLAQQVFQSSEPAKINSSKDRRTASTDPETGQRETGQDHKLVPPAADLSKLPGIDALATPTVLASNSSAASTQRDQDAPSTLVPKAQMALQCALGFGDTKCAKNDCNGGIGAVESVDYLGTNAAGDSLYVVKYQHRNTGYVVSRDPDGIADHYRVKLADPYRIKGTIASGAHPQSIYTRSENTPIVSACEPFSYPHRGALDQGKPDIASNSEDRNSSPLAAPVAASAVTNAPSPKTEAGIRCLLGLRRDGCWGLIGRPPQQETIDCWMSEAWNGECPSGPLESIEYLGTNASGDDVYSVKFMHENATYILRPPGPDGKIERVWLTSTRSSAGTVTSPAARILYTRPAEGDRQASAISSDAAAKAVVMANTPTGAGDPDAVVCRAPQPIASGKFGPQVCFHNNEWRKVALNGKDIAPDGKTLIDRPTVDHPKGDGDPDAVTCRTPARTWLGPDRAAVCQTNRFWAEVAKNHQRVDARGRVVGGGGWGLDYGADSYGNYAGGWTTTPDGSLYDSGHPSQSSAGTGNIPTMNGAAP